MNRIDKLLYLIRSGRGAAFLLLMLFWLTFDNAMAVVSLDAAIFRDPDIVVTVTATAGDRVSLVNAFDKEQVILTRIMSSDTRKFRLHGPQPVPCRLRVINLTTGERAVRNVKVPRSTDVPAGCAPIPPGSLPNVSINSTSRGSTLAADPYVLGPVPAQPIVGNTDYKVLAINDLGMHCGDLDTRVSSILPPFQVLLAQVIQTGAIPTVLDKTQAEVTYSAVSNPADPILSNPNNLTGVADDKTVYKTNFWDSVTKGIYDPFYPGGLGITPLATGGFPVTADVGLPVPNVENLYLGTNGLVLDGDESLTAVQHAMSGVAAPYLNNDVKMAEEFYTNKPFFINFPFGYVADGVKWFEGAGVPFSAFDDFGRENPYPMVRVQAHVGGGVVATTDTVLPISGEASCTNCHSTNTDYTSVHGVANRTDIPTDALSAAGLPVATSLDDPDANMPAMVSLEYAADINILRLHDLKHGANYVDPSPANDGTTVNAPCDISANSGNGDASCLTNKALVQDKPIVCQVCHYTPALDLAHVGPMVGPEGSTANGRNQVSHKSNSYVMHTHHGLISDTDRNGNDMFPVILPPEQDTSGVVTNQALRLAALDNNCYQCHPGKESRCLRGAMFKADMLCSDCHGSMLQIGDDFSRDVTPGTSGAFDLHGNFYTDATQPRVPWANEPGCGSCHTGDASSRLLGSNLVVNNVDTNGMRDNIRLRQAFRTDDAKATPIVPTNNRFAENIVQADFNGTANNGAGNPKLYRVSTGHGGVMCEGCHGATHAEWPNANPLSNDNLTATQLQGHAGVIADCSVCHGNAALEGINGPHGIHQIAYDSTPWADNLIHQVYGANFADCRVCHGGSVHALSCGTVLSRALADRTFSGTTIRKGEPVGCAVCHNPTVWSNTCIPQHNL